MFQMYAKNMPPHVKRVVLELLSLGSFVLLTLIFTFVYNYLRFDSIFEFGTKYQLTVCNVSYYTFELSDIFHAVYHYILSQFDFSPVFPFFSLKFVQGASYGNYLYSDICFGILAIPKSATLMKPPSMIMMFCGLISL